MNIFTTVDIHSSTRRQIFEECLIWHKSSDKSSKRVKLFSYLRVHGNNNLRIYRSVSSLVEQVFVCKKLVWFIQLHESLDPEIRLLASMCSTFMDMSVEDVGGAASVAI